MMKHILTIPDSLQRAHIRGIPDLPDPQGKGPRAFASDRFTIAGSALRTTVTRKASPFTLAEIEVESARRGLTLRQTTIGKGSNRKYALYYDTFCPSLKRKDENAARVISTKQPRNLQHMPVQWCGSEGALHPRAKPLTEALMTVSEARKPATILGCVHPASGPKGTWLELFKTPVTIIPDTIGPGTYRPG